MFAEYRVVADLPNGEKTNVSSVLHAPDSISRAVARAEKSNRNRFGNDYDLYSNIRVERRGVEEWRPFVWKKS